MKKYFFINDIDLFKNIFSEFRESKIDVIDVPLILLRFSFEKNIENMKYCLIEYFYEFLNEERFTYYRNKFNFSMKEFYSYTGSGVMYKLFHELDVTRHEFDKLNYVVNHYRIPAIPYIQLFYSNQPNFTEKNSITQQADFHKKNYTFSLNATSLSHLRLDPLNERCIIALHNVRIYATNGEKFELTPYSHNALFVNGIDYCFETNAPQLYFETPKGEYTWEKLELELTYKHLGNEVLQWTIPYRERELNQVKTELKSILTSRTFKLAHFLKRIIDFFRN